VLKQASDKLPIELDEAAHIDGATRCKLFRLFYVSAELCQSLVAIVTLFFVCVVGPGTNISNYTRSSFPAAVERPRHHPAVARSATASPPRFAVEIADAHRLHLRVPPAASMMRSGRYMVGGLTAGREVVR